MCCSTGQSEVGKMALGRSELHVIIHHKGIQSKVKNKGRSGLVYYHIAKSEPSESHKVHNVTGTYVVNCSSQHTVEHNYSLTFAYMYLIEV